MQSIFDTKIEFLKGVGPTRGALFNKELEIYTFGDLIQHYPFRYEDRTKFHQIAQIDDQMPYIQLRGHIRHLEMIGKPRHKRLIAYFSDGTGEIELVWFRSLQWIAQKITPGAEYIVFGKPTLFNRKYNIAHPELEPATNSTSETGYLQPVYSTTEKLKVKFVDSKAISRLQESLLKLVSEHIRETLPQYLLHQYSLMDKRLAMSQIHFPSNAKRLSESSYRLKFEEFFYIQLRLLKLKITRMDKFRGQLFKDTQLLTDFYKQVLPFQLTNAQKKVIKEIYRDMRSGNQMNRLIQGDVGSGKTIVSFICMLLAIGSGAQVALMAPTEILADQHYRGLTGFADRLGISMAVLKGSTTSKQRRSIHQGLQEGTLHILIGTHALIEDTVQFKNLGLAVIDEQHRFGVAQRARLWKKNRKTLPHILVMTATPIPRTLAMTLYGDLDISIIDELPAGRKEIKTHHMYESRRLKVFEFMRKQIREGRQIYVVYPLVEESAKLDLKHATDGYEALSRAFPEYPLGIVHGRMKAADKEYEMKRFEKNETKILVATTVIEVGVHVPNATVMVVENAERFGLAQLHQLRGRVGRGAEQSYCLLLTEYKLSKESKKRLHTMVETNDGFRIAETDLKLRGPGDLMGTQQSGLLDLLIADISKDSKILEMAREAAKKVLESDPELSHPDHSVIARQIRGVRTNVVNWSRIS